MNNDVQLAINAQFILVNDDGTAHLELQLGDITEPLPN